MKIMFCLGSMTKGGAERVIANLSNELIKKHEIAIVVTPPDKPMYELNKKIDFCTLDKFNEKNGSFLNRNFRRIRRLRRIIKNKQPDIIVSLLPEPTYRLMIAKSFLKIKTIISVRNDPNREYNNFFKKLLVRLLYSKADGFVFQTSDAKQWFSKKIQKKSVIIPNPLNSDFISKPYTGKRDNTIVTVGRLTEQKNHKLLVDAFSEVYKKHKEYTLKIYGDGVLRDDLKKQISSLYLNDHILLMGESNNIKDEIYKAGMFVLSSDFEGMPNALMEAMALGLPCISTNCPIGGPKELITNNNNGLLVDVNDKKQLIEAMNYIIENPDDAKIMGIMANKICKKLNPNIIIDTWEEYIIKVYGGGLK